MFRADKKGSHRMPPRPRIYVGGVMILPQVDEGWNVIPDRFMVPGCPHPMSAVQVWELANRNGQSFTHRR